MRTHCQWGPSPEEILAELSQGGRNRSPSQSRPLHNLWWSVVGVFVGAPPEADPETKDVSVLVDLQGGENTSWSMEKVGPGREGIPQRVWCADCPCGRQSLILPGAFRGNGGSVKPTPPLSQSAPGGREPRYLRTFSFPTELSTILVVHIAGGHEAV